MSILPDSNWINALKLPTRVMSGLFIASLIVLGLNATEVIILLDLGSLAKTIVVIVAVFSGSLTLTGIIAVFFDQIKMNRKKSLLSERHQIKSREIRERRIEAEKKAIKRLDYLSEDEVRHLAGCLREGSQSFYTYVHSPSVTTLAGKGLINTPGGTHHEDHYPFIVNDFVWEVLLERKDEILEKDENNRRKREEKKRSRRY